MANEPQISFDKLSALPEQVTIGRFLVIDNGNDNVEEYIGIGSRWKKITDNNKIEHCDIDNDLLANVTYIDGKVLIGGVIYDSADYKISNYIDLYLFSGIKVYTNLPSATMQCAFFDENYNIITPAYTRADGVSKGNNFYEITITEKPENARYFLFSTLGSESSNSYAILLGFTQNVEEKIISLESDMANYGKEIGKNTKDIQSLTNYLGETASVTYIDGKAMVSGGIYDSAGNSVSDYIDVSFASSIYLKVYLPASTLQCAFFTESKTLISPAYTSVDGTLYEGNLYEFYLNVPSNAKYFVFSTATANKTDCVFRFNNVLSDAVERLSAVEVEMEEQGENISKNTQDIANLYTYLGASKTITFIDGKAMVAGGIYDSSGNSVSDYIEVSSGQSIFLRTSLPINTLQCGFFTAQDVTTLISPAYTLVDGTQYSGTLYDFTLTAPSNAKYFVFTTATADKEDCIFRFNDVLDKIESEISNLEDRVNDIEGYGEDIDKNTRDIANIYDFLGGEESVTYIDGYAMVSGGIYPSGDYSVSDYIEVSSGQSIFLRAYLPTSTLQCAFFTEGKVLISPAYTSADGTQYDGNLYDFMLTVPNTAKYFVFTTVTAHKGDCIFRFNDVLDKIESEIQNLYEEIGHVLSGKKILVLGDSISDDTYHTPDYPAWNKWASYLAGQEGYELTNDSRHATGFLCRSYTNIYVPDWIDGKALIGGSITDASGYTVCDYIDVEGVTKTYLKTYLDSATIQCGFFTSNKTLITAYTSADATSHSGNLYEFYLNVPSNAKYFVFTIVTEHKWDFAFQLTDDPATALVNRVRKHKSTGEHPESYDAIVIFMGVNDFKGDYPFGSDPYTENKNQYVGAAMNDVLKYLTEEFPTARIAALLPLAYVGRFDLFNGINMTAFVEKMDGVYKYWNVPVLDLYNHGGFRVWNSVFNEEFGMLAKNNQGQYVHDGLHPNQTWDNNYLAPMILNFLNGLFM